LLPRLRLAAEAGARCRRDRRRAEATAEVREKGLRRFHGPRSASPGNTGKQLRRCPVAFSPWKYCTPNQGGRRCTAETPRARKKLRKTNGRATEKKGRCCFERPFRAELKC
jgi:hypothetical protein